MAKGQSHTLVLCWNMLPFPSFDQYVRSVQVNAPYWGHFDWNEMPEQVQDLVLLKASYDQAKAPSVFALIRPGAEQNLPEGFEVLENVMQAANAERQYQDEQSMLAWLKPLMERRPRAEVEVASA
jgi:hypothetical protein